MTFREKVIHENLKSALSNPHIIFVLLTPSKLSLAGSTHRMEYAAFISRSRSHKHVSSEQFTQAPCVRSRYEEK